MPQSSNCSSTTHEFDDGCLNDKDFLAIRDPALDEFDDDSLNDDDFLAAESTAVFHFLKLPPEIRNRCYEFVFVSPVYIGSVNTHAGSFHDDAVKWRNLGFARSCRQIYNESGHIFFAQNGFEFYYIRPFLDFLKVIGTERLRMITRLRYNFSGGRPHAALQYLKSCVNLQLLEVYLRVRIKIKGNCWWLYPLENAKDFFLSEYSLVRFGKAIPVGNVTEGDELPAANIVDVIKDELKAGLFKVKYGFDWIHDGNHLPYIAYTDGHRYSGRYFTTLADGEVWDDICYAAHEDAHQPWQSGQLPSSMDRILAAEILASETHEAETDASEESDDESSLKRQMVTTG